MAPPYPVLAALPPMIVKQRRRLGIMDDYEIVIAFQQLGIQFVVAQKNLTIRIAEVNRMTLRRIMEGLGNSEELFFTHDHLPHCIESDIAHQRDHGLQDLGNASSIRSCIYVQNPRSS